jgi:hypothetical protein
MGSLRGTVKLRLPGATEEGPGRAMTQDHTLRGDS